VSVAPLSHSARGQRERAASPWLGDGTSRPSATFEQYEALERSLTALWPADAPVAPTTAIASFMD
jgi:hypothetical protein